MRNQILTSAFVLLTSLAFAQSKEVQPQLDYASKKDTAARAQVATPRLEAAEQKNPSGAPGTAKEQNSNDGAAKSPVLMESTPPKKE